MNATDLIQLRNRFRWSQAEAAQQLGCSARSIANWEQGVNKIPESIALAASAVAMNLPPYSHKGSANGNN